MSSAALLERFLAAMVAQGHFPGATYALARSTGSLCSGQVGMRRLQPHPEPLPPRSVYDLASLTKPVVTATVAMLLAGQGLLRLDDPLSRYVPEARWGDGVRVEDLLLHTSGLPAWRPLYESLDPFGALLAEPLEREPHAKAVYSCLGYILLGTVLERVSGRGLRQLGRELVLEPLGMRGACFSGESAEAVPTEIDVPVGQVHDRNARALGGAPGNAGLFGTAEDLGLYASALLRSLRGEAGLLAPEMSREMVRPRARGADESRSWGWMVQDGFKTSAGERMGPRAFGHTGFTGCSLFFDPERDLAAILLTNRVHPRVRPTPMFDIRRQFHDLCCEVADLS